MSEPIRNVEKELDRMYIELWELARNSGNDYSDEEKSHLFELTISVRRYYGWSDEPISRSFEIANALMFIKKVTGEFRSLNSRTAKELVRQQRERMGKQ